MLNFVDQCNQGSYVKVIMQVLHISFVHKD